MTDLEAENVEPLSAFARRVIVTNPLASDPSDKALIVLSIEEMEAERTTLRASLEEKERFAQEMYEWVAVALDAAGWKTVFDIPDWPERSKRLKRLDGGEYNGGTLVSLSASLEQMREALEEIAGRCWRVERGDRSRHPHVMQLQSLARTALAETETEQS